MLILAASEKLVLQLFKDFPYKSRISSQDMQPCLSTYGFPADQSEALWSANLIGHCLAKFR